MSNVMDNLSNRSSIGLEEIDGMSPSDLITAYKNKMFLHLVMFTGDSVQYDKDGKQKTAKQPVDGRWQLKDVSLLAAINGFANGQWVGFMPPAETLCVDIDHTESVEEFERDLDKYIAAGYIISKTTKGYHLYGKAPAGVKYAKGSDSVNRDGFHCTTRDGEKTCCLEEPAPGKKWITDLDWDRLPELMPEWVPVMSKQKWEKNELKKLEDQNKSADQKAKEERSKAAAKHKANVLSTIIEKEIECIVRTTSDRNNAINKAAYTLSGLVAGATLYNVPINESEVLQRLTDAAEALMPDDLPGVASALQSGWTSGSASPMLMTDKVIGDAVQKAQTAAAIMANSHVIPAPGKTFDVDHSAKMAVDKILCVYDMFVYRDQLWGCENGKKDYRLLANFADETMTTSLSSVIKTTVKSFYDFDNLRSVPWVQGMTAPIVNELMTRLRAKPAVRLITSPCMVDGVWIDHDTDTIRILDIDVIEQSCTAQESMKWIMEEILVDYEFETEQDRNKAFIANFAHGVKNDQKDQQLPMIAYTGYQPGLGKTTLAKAAGSVSMDSSKMHCESLQSNEEEFRKAITTQLLSGVENYIIDNIKTMFSSSIAESLVTGTKWNDRILGGNRKCNIDRNCIFMLTVNNATMSEDMYRRYIGISMVKNYTYLTKPYRHSNIDEFIRTSMPVFRGHIQNIIKQWIAAGAPKDASQVGTSFTHFVENLGGIAKWLGLDTGLLIDEAKAKADCGNDYEDHHSYLALWIWNTFGDSEKKMEDILSELKRQKESWTISKNDPVVAAINMDSLIKDYETLSKFDQSDKINIKFGYVLRKLQKKVQIDGKIIHVEKRRDKYGNRYKCVVEGVTPVVSPRQTNLPII